MFHFNVIDESVRIQPNVSEVCVSVAETKFLVKFILLIGEEN